jgi:hypothetical protein
MVRVGSQGPGFAKIRFCPRRLAGEPALALIDAPYSRRLGGGQVPGQR